MTPYDDETLMRRIDGELDEADAARIDAQALRDPGLARRLATMRGLGDAAREAFPAAPDPLDAMLARRIAAASAPASARAIPRAAVWAGLMAASFVAGVVLAPLARGPAPGLALAPGGRLADEGLVQVLDRRLAAEGPDGRGRTIGLTFRDTGGRWCRTFVAEGVSGLACREGDGWAMQVLARSAQAPAGGAIRTAASATPASVLDAVDARLSGETLDAAAEARARDSGWE